MDERKSGVHAPGATRLGHAAQGRLGRNASEGDFPFRTIVVASTDDEYVTPERARFFAGCWGATIEFVEPAGHINSASGLGSWPAGLALLQELLSAEH